MSWIHWFSEQAASATSCFFSILSSGFRMMCVLRMVTTFAAQFDDLQKMIDAKCSGQAVKAALTGTAAPAPTPTSPGHHSTAAKNFRLA